MQISIKNRYDGTEIHAGDYASVYECMKAALGMGKSLRSADLRSPNLSSANLSSADLRSVDLRSANLRSADLSYADLSFANLSSANLRSANLSSANLSYADLSFANLSSANLSSANLRSADLRSADLSSADLRSADLRYAKNIALVIARTRILPEGALIGWKKCADGVIVKLRIPEEAKRSHAFGRKCRAQFADVLEVIGASVAYSRHDREFAYVPGQRVTPKHSFCEDWQYECESGIHFYITREEAEAHE